MAVYIFWYTFDHVLPDLKLVLAGEYSTVEITGGSFTTRRISHSKGKDDFKVLLYDRCAADVGDMPFFMFNPTLEPFLELQTTPYLFREIEPINDNSMPDTSFSFDGQTFFEEVVQPDPITVQFYYLPHTKCLLGYEVLNP
jgi:hypothetical protein